MVAVQTRYDDVLLALKGKKKEATHTMKVRIPGILRASGKAKRAEIDVSEEGEKYWNEKFWPSIEKELLAVGAKAEKVFGVEVESRPTKRKPQSEDESAEAEDTSEDTEPTEENTTPSDDEQGQTASAFG